MYIYLMTNNDTSPDPLLDTLTAAQAWQLVQAERGDTDARRELVEGMNGHQTWLLLQRDRRS